MKKITFLVFMLLTASFFSCDTEEVTTSKSNKSFDFKVIESNVDFSTMRESLDDPCTSVRLMAGQHHDAGTVTIDNDGTYLILTYTTNADWTINLTHMSIGDCEEQWVPTTGSGNPKVGHFEHTEPHSTGTNEVVYMLNLDMLAGLDKYCFAAHAEVYGPTGGETAWAEGLDFDGNSWAMYVEAWLSDCEVTGDDDVDDPNK